MTGHPPLQLINLLDLTTSLVIHCVLHKSTTGRGIEFDGLGCECTSS